ncbi:inverted formin-2 isoform X2 [Planococcus citri]|uniref:inverted formin-2 isoform X2 n=1 Tax=Planococcus citri TaxID=170843 RepID=UPI0031F90B28
MESRIGLDYIVENVDYTAKLAKALDCDNITVKKQVFELLSALCVYNSDGYSRALQALEQYKEFKSERYRLKLIVDELRNKENPLDYKTTLLAFVNCLIISTPQLKDRVRIRNEFIGLKLLAVLDELRRYVSGGNCGNYADLGVQLDVFHEQRENDEAQILDSPYGVDLNSHVDVFYAILRQVAETPQEIPFLSILQHLLRIDPKEAISDIIWDTAETLVHRATLLESRQDATRILRSPSVQSRLCCHNHRSVPDTVCGSRKQSLNIPTSPLSTFQSCPVPPPPPPPDPPSCGLPPPPPPPPPQLIQLDQPGDQKMGAPPVPPPLIAQQERSRASPEPSDVSHLRLPQQETPTPKTKMKTINWNKIPNNKVVGKHNIWSEVARSHQHSPMADLDWSEMEGLFCQQAPPSTVVSCQSSPKLSRNEFNESGDRRRKEPSEIVLLDGKRSLNVNIFLKQFRCSNEDIIQIIREGGHDDIGAEKLRGLLKMLPEIDELEMLKAFDGNKTKLANAEKFLLELVEVPNYKLRIESMLLKEEFASNMSYLEPSINSMIVAGEDLMTNKALQEVLYMVICAGNFLNSGGYAGNAAGVKLSSLQKLTDIRANKPGMNLIHYVAMQIEKKRKDLMRFTDDMSALEDAAKTTVEQLQNEVQALENRIQKIKKQVELPSTENEIKDQMRDFLKIAEQEVSTLQHDLRELEMVRKTLADFFCEDPATFKIEECFKIFHVFCVKFKQAVAENERRRIQEEQASARRKQREEQLAAKKRSMIGAGNVSPTGGITGDSHIMDILLNDMQSNGLQKRYSDKESRSRKIGINGSMLSEEESPSVTNSPIVSRRRLGSFGDSAHLNASNKEDTCSPDITPTGSLRRRRSRVPSEEDESTLMDFLRSAEQESARERKSWGSLDRSWARRARGGKKRPDLLNADFSNDRERPASPSPVLENKTLLPTPEEEVKPKAWRQKIEAWLQENEKEEKQNAEMLHKTQRRHYSSRRSLENDSENEGRDSNASTPVDGISKYRRDPLSKLQEQVPTYQRVYSDWKPTIDKTDVVGTMEAIAGMQPQSHLKDKSAWRKSQLNTSAGEDVETESRKLRRMRSRGSIDSSPPLEAIKEEEKKKGINNAEYSTSPVQKSIINVMSAPLEKPKSFDQAPLPPFAPRKSFKRDIETIDKIEIDSDNIETPPATRKLMNYSRSSNEKPSSSGYEEETLGDGQFDRFSSARRTRRYRKSQDDDSSKDVVAEVSAEKQILRPTTLKVKSQPVDSEDPENKEIRLKQWQDKLVTRTDAPQSAVSPEPKKEVKNKIPVLQSSYLRNNRMYSTLPHSFKSRIATSTAARQAGKLGSRADDKPLTQVSSFIPEIKVRALTPTKTRIEHENDEGFEETQSLISDSPSQTTSSGCNYDIDNIDSPSPSMVISDTKPTSSSTFTRTDSSGSGDASGCDTKTKLMQKKPEPKSLLPKRTASMRLSKPVNGSEDSTKFIRTSSVSRNPNGRSDSKLERKFDTGSRIKTPTPLSKNTSIQRYPSKSSLKSSRSSLNSCASISTVKNVKPNAKLDNYTNVIKTLTSNLQKSASRSPTAKIKKPLTPVQFKSKTNSNSAATSRSSSSASSVEPTKRNGSLTLSTSFKENSSDMANDNFNRFNAQSFMRPTASSSAKDMTDTKPKLIIRTPFK